MLKYAHVADYVYSTPWAITGEKLGQILYGLACLRGGQGLSAGEIEAIVAARREASPAQVGTVAVLPLMGTIAHRAGMLTDSSGGISTETFGKRLNAALADPGVAAILIDVDSPGGAVNGVGELSAQIFNARAQKPIGAIANSLMASAAYWIASAADRVYAIPSAEVGSVGVIAAHEDHSEKLAKEGVKIDLITAGEFKGEGASIGPLTDEARAYLRSRVDEYYGAFVADLSRNRGVSERRVKEEFGKGRVLGAAAAKEAHMIDAVVQTLDEAASNLLALAKRRNAPKAEDDLDLRKRRTRALERG